ncbi:MAG: leucine-rich repeat protein [Prevotella sp.]|nr:leucine-rich repeat protein [Prevotella sp.]
MRKVYIVLISLFFSLMSFAGEVTEEQAFQKAQQFMKGKQFKQTNLRRASSTGDKAYFVFNVENNGGFVIVAGNDLMPEVLGYAEQGNLNLSKVPDNVKWLLDYYARIAQSMKKSPMDNIVYERVASRRRASAQLTELIPLMKTEWDQTGVYQQHCPEIGGNKALTGCVATAMAQVVNFYQWPLNSVRSTVGYKSNKDDKSKPQLELETLPARKFNWFNMSDDDIAWLMRYCGQSVLMNYNTDESSAYATSIPGALISVFNFSKGADIVNRNEFTDEEWEQALYHEIELGRPVIYSGYKNKSGHTFVLHGYKDGKFYINWGWGGNLDGYFALTALTPGSMDFTEEQNAVVGVQPASNNDINYDEKPEIGFREVHLEKQGQLASLLPESERYLISRLKITGEIGGKDFDVIRDMSENKYGQGTEGRLSKLDLSEARIVGGETFMEGIRTVVDNEIVDDTFNGCSKLTSLILPSTTISIGQYAFASTSLTEITIPKDVNFISGNAFTLPGLKSLKVDEGNQTFFSQNNAIYEKASGKLIRGCQASGIPEGVVEIGDMAFQDAGLESIVLPKSLKKIGYRAFMDNQVKDIYIPESVEYIDLEAFLRCGMVSITVDTNNKTYDSRDNCNAIIETATNTLIQASDITVIPNSVTALGRSAFSYVNTKMIEIPQSVNSFGQGLFEYCQVTTYKLPFSEPPVLEDEWILGPADYNYIKENARLIVPNGTKEKYSADNKWGSVFTHFDRKILEVSEYETQRALTINVETAGTLESKVADKKGITEELKVTGNINGTDIKTLQGMCGQYGMLTAIDLSDATIVEGEGTVANELPEGAFQTTTALEHIVLPKNLMSIGAFAFQDSGVEELVLPKTVIRLGRDIFYYARNLKALSVEEGNPVFDSRNNCNAIIETASNTLRIGCINTVIPATVTALGDMAFSGKPGLKEIEIPNSVTSIGWAAFWADTELTNVKMSAAITNLDDSPFGGCDRITSFVIDETNPKYDSRNNCNAIIETASNTLIQGFSNTEIPEGVKTIASAAFRSLSTLTEIEIPASVEKIEAEAFLYCNQMTKVVSHIKKPFAVSSMVFSGDNMKIAKLYVPYGTKDAYANTPGWDSFPYIIEMEPVAGEYPQNAASVTSTDFGKAYAALNGEVSVPITLLGEGLESITSIDYSITTGGYSTAHHLELQEPITFMKSAEVLVPVYADAATGESEKVFTLTKVNEVANECTTENMKASGKLVTVVKKPKVVPVLEEATGTWCGWCARGIPALNLLNKIYGNNVITIAAHGGGSGDPMILDNYQLNMSSYPSCMINRGEAMDPYYGTGDQAFGISREIEAIQRSYVPAGIEVEAEWADESQEAIKVKTTTTFVDDVNNANYRIGYLLLSDELTGNTSEWAQSNYYAGSTVKDENLEELTNKPSKIEDAVYNNVPVAVWEPFNGIEGSVPATITKDVAMEHLYMLDIKGNTRIQKKLKLSVVALLINNSTGKIVNAAKFKFEKDNSSGSSDVILGDANGDKLVNVTDIVATVNKIMDKPSADFNIEAADINKDGLVNVTDIVGMVNIIMKGGTQSAREVMNDLRRNGFVF